MFAWKTFSIFSFASLDCWDLLLLIFYLWWFLFLCYSMFFIWVKEDNFYLYYYLWQNWKEVMMVAKIDKNMEWHILNLFLIVCFNMRSIIFFFVQNTTKPVYQSSFSSKKWSNCYVRTSRKQCLLLICMYENYKIARHWIWASFILSYKVLTWVFFFFFNVDGFKFSKLFYQLSYEWIRRYSLSTKWF